MKKVKVCYIISTLRNCGPVNILYGILTHIDYALFEISIITFNPEREDSRIADFCELPISVKVLTDKRKLSLFKIYKGLKCEIEKIGPDIIHGHCPGGLFLIPLLRGKCKKVFTPHNFPGKHIRLIYGGKKGIIVQMIHNLMIGHFDKVICCSESVLEAYNRPSDSRFIAIPNGTTMPVWKRDMEEKFLLRKEFGLKDDIKYFIYIGRFAAGKNIPILLKVFNELDRNDVKLLMVGNGPLYEDVRAINSPNIILTGYTTRVYDYLKAADYYISASDSEGMPNTLLENMTVGNPMLLSSIPAHNEFMRNFSPNEVALSIDQHCVEDICEKIDSILSYDTNIVAEKIQMVLTNRYSAKVMSESYQKIYNELVKL